MWEGTTSAEARYSRSTPGHKPGITLEQYVMVLRALRGVRLGERVTIVFHSDDLKTFRLHGKTSINVLPGMLELINNADIEGARKYFITCVALVGGDVSYDGDEANG